MAIPPFDGITGITPPYLGTPANSLNVSPYQCSVADICGCQHLGSTSGRKAILNGFLDFRKTLLDLGIRGFQWLDGSFLEDVETHLRRAPNDLDVVTFVEAPTTPAELRVLLNSKPQTESPLSKTAFHVDSYVISLGSSSRIIVDHTRFWYGLFSHRRSDGIWKGMLAVELLDSADDDKARIILGGQP